MVEAARSLCPRMDADGLAVEVDSRPAIRVQRKRGRDLAQRVDHRRWWIRRGVL